MVWNGPAIESMCQSVVVSGNATWKGAVPWSRFPTIGSDCARWSAWDWWCSLVEGMMWRPRWRRRRRTSPEVVQKPA